MERRIPLVIFFLAILNSISFSQNADQNQKIQILLWAERDAYPGLEWEGSVARLKKIAPLFVGGLLYGWNFEYTPQDTARGVTEYFDCTPVQELSDGEIKSIQYKNAAEKDGRLYCRVEFLRSESQQNLYESWRTVSNARIRGKGYGALSDGFDGIQTAAAAAMKNAVREYWRTKIKNKPKEIDGRLILSAPPVVGVESGRYTVTLDFFMETTRILEYKTF